MEEKVDWEKKEVRIAWESITKSLCEVQAALIQSGNVKFKNLAEAMQDIDMSRQIEFAEFLTIGGNLSFQTPQKPQEHTETPIEQEQKQEPRDATPKMKSCIWGLAFGNDADPELKNELAILGLTKFNTTKAFVNYTWAHDFIDRNKKVN